MALEIPISRPFQVAGLRSAGILLIVCALTEILALSHHPTVGPRAPAETLTSIVALSAQDRIVHGSIIVVLIAQLYASSIFALSRVRPEFALGGLIVYSVGTGGLTCAALLDGFILPDIATHGALSAALRIGLIFICSVAVQICTKFSLIAIAAAMIVWSIDVFLSSRRHFVPVIAAAVSAVATGWFVWSGPLRPYELVVIVGAQSIWYLTIGTLLAKSTRVSPLAI